MSLCRTSIASAATTRMSWAAATLALLVGCANGPSFVEPETPAAGEAVVYLYRVAALPGAGIKHGMLLNERPVGRLLNGSYLRVAVPATAQFSDLRAAGCARLKQPLALRPAEIAYVQLALVSKTVEFGGRYYFDYGCELHRRGESDALPVITGLPRAD